LIEIKEGEGAANAFAAEYEKRSDNRKREKTTVIENTSEEDKLIEIDEATIKFMDLSS
jgi:hypothetical protein